MYLNVAFKCVCVCKYMCVCVVCGVCVCVCVCVVCECMYLLYSERWADLLSPEDHGSLGQNLGQLEGVQAKQLTHITDHWDREREETEVKHTHTHTQSY